MAITKEQAIDILDKFDFFQGQRAGRELWNEKPKEVQDEDIATFSKNVALLKEYIADVVPRSEVEELKKAYANYEETTGLKKAKQEMACQIVDMQDKILCDTIIAFAQEQGVTDLFLLDKEFVKTALINEAKRRQGVNYEKDK